MLSALREAVLDANQSLGRLGLAPFTFGNASAIDRAAGLVAIKPSGVPYERMTATDIVITDLDGTVVDGTLKPSSDLPTHLVLYRAFAEIGGIVHTHSHFATVWAQARREIPCLGTTHADYFHGPVPVTADLGAGEIAANYEANTGHAIARRFAAVDPLATPAVLVASHASFCWGRTVPDAVRTAAVLEEVAQMAYHTLTLQANAEAIDAALHAKHFLRKHGPDAYYGQR
ncbi:MAG: L-ribulose-5-phosphate 4-epimerase AraD [Gemmatimonadota bacterium]|nr:L-ribulose-5-phosphate 4-epimerase AraD [Gemmatimonadota bacterium]MDE3171614.1 L-ribulose-5-phosphate 4-epimerase AraD [Gemmatimonadota bacterium]MDE3216858.1 L-ribulose-5-phosphate 4-epimerase AraD [Gemmatimonadota bacterium]